MLLSSRQELVLRKVVEYFQISGQPVSSKGLVGDDEIVWGPSTIRAELAQLEDMGLLGHPHTSAGRVPTDGGYRYFVDNIVKLQRSSEIAHKIDLSLVRHEVDEAMQTTVETLSKVTDLLAVVSAPPIETATVRRVEVLLLQPNVLMVVVITSTGGVTKRIFSFNHPVDQGLADWAGSYLNEQLQGIGLGARTLQKRLIEPDLSITEKEFLGIISPVFTQLEGAGEDVLYFDGAAKLLDNQLAIDRTDLSKLVEQLERRVNLLAELRTVLDRSSVSVSIGSENSQPALKSLALVSAGYGLPSRNLGTVSVIGPTGMNYQAVISTVQVAAFELSKYVESLYEAD